MPYQQPVAPMRQQLITDDSFSEAEAMHLVRSLGGITRRPARNPRDGDPTRKTLITRTVETAVIPRLLETCLNRQAPELPPAIAPAPAMAEAVSTLTHILLTGDQPQARDFVTGIRDSGVAYEHVLLNLLTPAARSLGVMWAEDDCDFSDVTIGMLRLANVMRLLSGAFDPQTAAVQGGPRALLVQAPGEQHGFGVAMVACFFRRAGWTVSSEPVADRAALVSHVQSGWFSLVGISLACADRLESLAADIRAIRAASRNPAIGVMVGGYAFIEHPQLAAMVGADGTASDGRLAVRQANALISQLACQA